MISEGEIEKALDYLRDNAEKAAQARANRIYCEEFRKCKKALLMKQSNAEAISAQERDAYAHPEYQEFIEGLRAAVFEDERHRFLLAAASAKIDAWRSEQANLRTMGKII